MLHEAMRAMDDKTKPPGSLGRLEALGVQLACVQRTLAPVVRRARVVVFAGDHGVTEEGVSAYPSRVTVEMMRNFSRGGAAINVIARANGVEVEVVDVGVAGDLCELDNIVHAKVRHGTRNFAHGPALTAAEVDAALHAGRMAARRAAADGVDALGLGEMGIGNTTAAAAILSALTGISPAETVGRGTGIDDAGLIRKREVVEAALSRHASTNLTPHGALAAVGGLEITAIAGAAIEAPRHGVLVVADGFISTVGVLAACRIDPAVRDAVAFSHRSAERGHGHALRALDACPLLDLDLRLGEGTGAALAMPFLRAAAAVMCDMATFAEAGVSRDA
jgi:nicotinate-nucleotide--dimethylbenzimidazole phosphoribosyltransferase